MVGVVVGVIGMVVVVVVIDVVLAVFAMVMIVVVIVFVLGGCYVCGCHRHVGSCCHHEVGCRSSWRWL